MPGRDPRAPLTALVLLVALAACGDADTPASPASAAATAPAVSTAPASSPAAHPPAAAPAPAAAWLTGSDEQRLATLAAQLRGLDVAMWETGYRYSELYFAGADGQWDYAAYQADKLATALETALVRRPAREPSARPYLDQALPAVRTAIGAQDHTAFLAAFDELTAACNQCHQAEQVGGFTVRTPRARLSPIRP